MKKLVFKTENPTYGYKGILFTNKDKLGNQIVHEVEDDLADEILSMDDTPFREVGDDGEVVPTEEDLAAEKAKADDIASRTITTQKTPKPEAPKPAVAKGKTVITKTAKKGTGVAPAKPAEEPAAPAAPAATEGAADPSTEGAVSV